MQDIGDRQVFCVLRYTFSQGCQGIATAWLDLNWGNVMPARCSWLGYKEIYFHPIFYGCPWVITEEEKAEFEQAVENYHDAEPIKTDSKYVEEAKATEEYKETVAKHEADKPDQSTYVDDIYETETDAVNAHEEDHRDWEGEKPSEYDYIINTTYADDLEAWVDSEPDFNEYFGIEAQE